MSDNGIVLGSSSVARLELLKRVGIEVEKVVSADIDESVRVGEKPYEYVRRMSRGKARRVREGNEGMWIVTADTVVVKGGRILGKPRDEGEERDFLGLLSGGRHSVLTSYTVVDRGGKEVSKVVKTVVLVKKLSEREKEWYVGRGEWEGKAGGYGIQGAFEVFIKQINGSVSNVVGLPMMNVYNTLLGMGYKVGKEVE